MKGLKFILNEEKKDKTQHGWKEIEILDMHISRIEKGRADNLIYYYELIAIGDGKDFMTMDKDEFLQEVEWEIYTYKIPKN